MPTVPPSFTATQPIDPPTSARPRVLEGAAAARRTSSPSRPPTGTAAAPAALPPPAAAAGLPRWAKGVVIGGVLLAVAMPASVLLGRSMLVQQALAEAGTSKAAMVCTAGEGRAVDGSSWIGWLFGGSYFHCGDWETREARQQRERDREQASFLARERARQQPR
jgi:hypothetical protein